MRFLRSFALTGPPWLAAVLLAVLCTAHSASAVSVQYSTIGTFGSTNTTASSGGSLSFVGVVLATVNEPSLASLGEFHATGTTETFVNESFTLDIFQLLPGSGNGSLVGTLTGKLQTSQSGLVLTFSSSSTVISSLNQPDVTYALFPGPVLGIAPSTTNSGVTTVNAQISAVPLPAAAWGGMALFGVLGGAKLRRSRQSVMA